MKCRHCGAALSLSFLDLGSAPLSNGYLTESALSLPELWYPLRLLVCTECWLVQTEDYAGREILFSPDYAYFSSTSASWVDHAARYVDAMAARFLLGPDSTVVEVAANDGYLLQHVLKRGISCYGIEPTAGTAAAAREKGVEVLEEFFGVELARFLAGQGRYADLMVANNVLAHVPDINDFVAGLPQLLKEHGVATFEFPHLLEMVRKVQFDTAYHEHYSYLSLSTVKRVFEANGLEVFDVEQIPTHGGSLRVFAQRMDTSCREPEPSVARLLGEESLAGVESAAFYAGFQARAEKIKNDLLTLLLAAKRAGLKVGAYGAAAKGNTLLNFAGVKPDLLPFVCDAAPSKQGKYLPGSRIPILAPDALAERRPDNILILPWNLRTEITEQLAYTREWGAKFVTTVPSLEVS